MERYYYKAFNQSGDTVEGSISGSSYSKVLRLLERDGLEPFSVLKIEEDKEHGKERTFRIFSFSSNKNTNIIIFTKQLANLLRAGIQLGEALDIIGRLFKESKFKNNIIDLTRLLKGGSSFSSALEKYPEYFDSTYISMIKAGEESGYLSIICDRLAVNLEDNHRLRSFISISMIYPVILIIVSILAVLVILLYVLPKFTAIYTTYEQSLPLPTYILLSISGFVKNNYIYIIITISGLFLGLKCYSKSAIGKEKIDIFKLNTPIFGALFQKLAVSRVTGSLGVLLGNGVPLLKSLRIIRDVTANIVFAKALDKISMTVERGVTLSQAFDNTGIFPDMVVYLIGVGEQTGELDEMLKQLGQTITEEYKEELEKFLKLFEPIILLLMGLAIGFIVFAMLLPVMRINTMI